MRVFVTVVDLGSQSAAADHLDLSRPVVSRYLAELEDWWAHACCTAPRASSASLPPG